MCFALVVFIIEPVNADIRSILFSPSYSLLLLWFAFFFFLFPRLFLFLFTITDTNYGGEDVQIQHNRMSWNEETLA